MNVILVTLVVIVIVYAPRAPRRVNPNPVTPDVTTTEAVTATSSPSTNVFAGCTSANGFFDLLNSLEFEYQGDCSLWSNLVDSTVDCAAVSETPCDCLDLNTRNVVCRKVCCENIVTFLGRSP